ncbi:efflux RND transporter permease subunit [Sediminitomix flava]|uniref:Multidrug efflux pump subunit AcrB n=1 Tax=Sediminitomix flava TaxID=379075 RepID=A0A315ZHF6_SEDFL|nr:efflux RND transporter permease subunit [Sediminitomix flava]PWJ44228.1 multidrug efflux pump subunit AcrB [Sediminitomix flava]
MSLTDFTLKNKPFSWFALALVLLGGMFAYLKIGKLEDAPFTIKQAVVLTTYPGASAEEVSEQVTDKLEEAIQSLGELDYVETINRPGVSRIDVYLKKTTKQADLQQVWDKLRRKVGDAQTQLPSGAGPSIVNDDFADVLGVFYGIYGDGFSYKELNDYADELKKEILKVPNVAKVNLFGKAQESIDIQLSLTTMSELGISMDALVTALNQQNQLVNSGFLNTPTQRIRIQTTGDFDELEAIKNFLITAEDGSQIPLKDIATLKQSYVEPFTSKMKIQGLPAIGIAISTVDGANVVDMASAVASRLQELEEDMPSGLLLKNIYDQGAASQEANDGFVINLVASVGTVVLILLFFIGLKNGILVGSGLIFSILGTLIVMWVTGLNMERVSLAALIIAMGMLVDNSIVVVEATLMAMKRGIRKGEAIMMAVKGSAWPLLGATIIAILTFLPIRLSPDNTGEYLSSLFSVLAISLTLSWIFAMTQTPLVCDDFIKDEEENGEQDDPYQGKFYDIFRKVLNWCIAKKYIALSILIGLFITTIFSFRFLSVIFMPDLDKPMIKVNAFLPEGARFGYTEEQADAMFNWLITREGVKEVTTTIGQTPPRYFLASSSFGPQSNYFHLIVECEDFEATEKLLEMMEAEKETLWPDVYVRPEYFSVMSPKESKVQARFMGPDPVVLDSLANEAMEIMRVSPYARHIHSDWNNMSAKWSVEYAPEKAAHANVTRAHLANAFQTMGDGITVGVYREKDKQMPIIIKTEESGISDMQQVNNLTVMAGTKSVPLEQVTKDLQLEFEYPVVKTYNRRKAISAMCDPVLGVTTGMVQKDITEKIEGMDLPDGYSFMWDAEKKSQQEAVEAILTYFPLAILLIIGILIALFGDYKQPLIVIVMLPMSLIGLVFGLILLNKPFDFMSFIGWIGLLGMIIKNVIVLLDEANVQRAEGQNHYNAIMQATVSRMRPVLMAAITTMFGMVPLIPDSVFGSMSVSIIFGLGFATFLTLLAVPVFYAIFYNVKEDSM